MVTNVVFYVHRTGFPLGAGILPAFINNKRSIVGLECNSRCEPYRDNLCVFRCLSYHRHSRQVDATVRPLYNQWVLYMTQQGVNLPLESTQFRGLVDFIECFTTTFLRAHSWLNRVDSGGWI